MPKRAEGWQSIYDSYYIASEVMVELHDKLKLLEVLKNIPIKHDVILQKLGLTEQQVVEEYNTQQKAKYQIPTPSTSW